MKQVNLGTRFTVTVHTRKRDDGCDIPGTAEALKYIQKPCIITMV